MIFDTKDTYEVKKFFSFLRLLLKKYEQIKLEGVNPKRTISQNSYVHKLFSLFGIEFGYTVDEAKILIKRKTGYTYEKEGEEYFMRTRDFDTKQMTDFIDKFRNFSSKQGCYLPTPDEYRGKYKYFENLINVNSQYL